MRCIATAGWRLGVLLGLGLGWGVAAARAQAGPAESGSATGAAHPSLPVTATALPGAAESPGWYWTAGPDLYPFVSPAAAKGPPDASRYVLWREVSATDTAGPVRVRRERADGKVLWSVAVPQRPGVAASENAYLAGGAIAVAADRIYVAQYHRIATGCALSALSAADGRTLWTVRLEGVGPVSHSKYSNRVQLAVDNGDPVVRGWESAARYIERRDGATGAFRTNQKLAGARLIPDVNESIYQELARMLRQHPRYEVAVRDFVVRHGIGDRFPDQAARLGLARDARARLGGLPVYATSWRMQLDMKEAADGGDVLLQAFR